MADNEEVDTRLAGLLKASLAGRRLTSLDEALGCSKVLTFEFQRLSRLSAYPTTLAASSKAVAVQQERFQSGDLSVTVSVSSARDLIVSLARTSEPVPGVRVTLEPTPAAEPVAPAWRTAVTNEAGEASLGALDGLEQVSAGYRLVLEEPARDPDTEPGPQDP